MKLHVHKGTVSVSADTAEDMVKLIQLVGTYERPAKEATDEPKKRPGQYVRRAKRRVPCPKCGKMVKGLKLHDTLVHPERKVSLLD